MIIIHRPPKKVREALGEDVVDQLMDWIIAVHNDGYPASPAATAPAAAPTLRA
jgi:hypothetical protein